ncbi:SDR family oxidoreductase [Yersinia enterocolitica]|uniref:oxidoreductase n=1 Tax=Yersinia enterocolitica TaxID=630 RepID=UPI00155B00A1|nr:oxidoreductase [Yersinia enterocolitica]MBX9482619.1 SDR family oxidoreductase [Yersinia enterocolitica]NQS94639.1 SDR family oxidoreductase [Yersinia enterocolitica]NQT44849.1 SDR family oxidoreductase [Yersinia enterocolitica]NQT99338.1 SDR family oxidoreductase [Yersinia enterocolitica]HDL6874742.1 SDR family oxidoreductase [Yersinia enterocolitica]
MLTNKIILVAGAGGLLGCQLVKAIQCEGGKVIAFDISKELMISRLNSAGVNLQNDSIQCLELDINNEKEVKLFFSKLDHVSGAVNATYPRNKLYGAHFYDVTLNSFNENLSLHLGAAFLFTQQFALYFEKHKKPLSLVNISSVYGVVAPKFEIYKKTNMTMPVEYAAIKSAIIHISKYVVAYVNNSNFRINSISPGGILDKQPGVFLDSYRKETCGQGMLDVADVVGTVLFLLSDLSKYVTGQNIIIDDGFSL